MYPSNVFQTLEGGWMNKNRYNHLSRREKQIMDIIYERGSASVADVQANIADPPSYSAVRALLRILEEKGHLRHEKRGNRYMFKPTLPPELARKSMVRHLVKTFFDGSAEKAMTAILKESAKPLSEAEYQKLRSLIEKAREEEDT
jgi:predicted transcriptional regulator